MKIIDNIIERLGYSKSENLIYVNNGKTLENIDKCIALSRHNKRILHELTPYAFYIMDGNVLVLFFNDLNNREHTNIHGKLWNAQIPIIISDEGEDIKIYNGKSMNLENNKKIKLKDIISYDLNQFDEKNEFSYWNITNSLSLNLYEKSIDKKNLNEFLIDNLKYITKSLKNKYKISFANKLMLRILFIRYLIDRGVNIGYMGLNNNVTNSQEKFLSIIKDKEEFFKLIKYLKNRFNGNLFEMDELKERSEITKEALSMLHDFLTARQDLKTKQLSLFPFYNFNFIPIELISNIYEILLGKEKKDKDKAYYTPEYLADYIVDRTVKEFLVNENECKILDPSCGSGIFLIKSLQKILEKNSELNGFFQNKNKLNKLIENNIYGIDYNEEAIDVTIFSLYITLFDYQDPKKLEGFKLPLLKNNNIIFGDFFDEKKTKLIENIEFKFILGNPPWGQIKNQEKYKEYCKNRKFVIPNKEICTAFLLKVKDLGTVNTKCSLIIPSKILYKIGDTSINFRKELLTNIQLEQVLEISSVRKQIFKEAIAPAAVFSFLCRQSSTDHKVEYISLKPNKFLRLYNLIMVESNDIKYVKQKLFMENDYLWKILVYGGYWDFELFNDMKINFDTIENIILKKGLIMKKGLQDNDGKADSSHLIGKKILNSKSAVDHFYLDDKEYTIFNKKKINRPRSPEIYKAPYVLFKKGVDSKNYSIKAVYTEKDFLYRDTITCIKGSKEDENILLNLCGLLNSSLFSYFNLMLGSSVGIEREQIFLEEIAKYPYRYSDKLVEIVKKIQQQIKNDGNSDKLRVELNRCVMDMYGLSDNYFIDYALSIQIPILCGVYKEIKCNKKLIEEYAKVFSKIWNRHFENSGVYYTINIYPDIKGKFAALEIKLSLKEKKSGIIVNDINDDIDLLTKFMIYQKNDYFYQKKDIVEFSEDSIIIVKSIEAKNWHSAMAIKDSSKVINKILLNEEKRSE